LYNKNFSTLIQYPREKPVVIPHGVTSIGDYALAYHRDSTSIIIPGSVTSIGEGAFVSSRLISVIIPSSVTYIGEEAFSKCINLRAITIPDSVTSIMDGTFIGSGLTSITIPGSVTSIGKDAFADCDSLTSMTILNPTPPSIPYNSKWRFWLSPFRGVNKDVCTLHVPKGSVEAYRKAHGWEEFKNIEPMEDGYNVDK
jgi:hypothetical protein